MSNDIKVERLDFPVTLSDGNTYVLVGYLYCQGSAHNRPLQVTLHGGNDHHAYWDLPSFNEPRTRTPVSWLASNARGC